MTSAIKKVAKYTPIGMISNLARGDEAPSPDPVKPMPVNDEDSTRMARRKSLMTQRRRGGRASTVLSKTESLG